MPEAGRPHSQAVNLSIIVPVLNEAEHCRLTLVPLQHLRGQGVELIVVDGGSQDGTIELVSELADYTLKSNAGRALQMNTGAALAQGEYLLFLHADTFFPDDFADIYQQWRLNSCEWGFFSLRLSGSHWLLKIVECAISWRSRLTGVATGDQCLFVRRALFEGLGAFPELPLMEDVAMSKQLRKIARPQVEPAAVITSSRRWEKRGILKTICLMWTLRLAYFIGVPPQRLFEIYYPKRRSAS